MRKILLLLLLIAAPSQAATRLYFGTSVGSLDAYESFAADSGWEDASAIRRGELHPLTSSEYAGRGGGDQQTVTLTQNSANQDIESQWQMRLDAGVTFTSGVTTVKMQGRMEESTATDDVDKCIIGLRIIATDGTVRATLLSVANYGSTLEFITSGSGKRNHTCADGDTVQATYTTVDGDYLVLENGFQTDGATGVNPGAEATLMSGSGYPSYSVTTIGDCPENNTETGSCTSWIEFSNTFSRAAEPNGPATRWWFPATTAADVSPAVCCVQWNGANDEVQYRKLVKTKGASAITNGQTLDMVLSTREVDRSYVSEPLAAGVVFTQGATTISAGIQMQQLATNDETISITVAAQIVSEDGSTQRVVLLQPRHSGFLENSAAATPVSKSMVAQPVIDSYTTVAGDRIVVELGAQTRSSAVTPQVIITYGEDDSDCLFGDWTTSGGGCSGWVEFSNEILLASEVGRNPVVIH